MNLDSRSHIQHNIPLAPLVWFRTGGAAEYYATPENNDALCAVLTWARDHGAPITLLGEGANTLIADQGVRGLLLRPLMQDIAVHNDPSSTDHALVTAGAGCSFQQLITTCLSLNLLGLEEFSGIPGTVGGSVYINIHFFSFLLSHFLVHATVADPATCTAMQVDATWFQFGYNTSTLHHNKHILVDATFRVRKAKDLEVAYARGRRDEMIRYRGQRYPKARTCGSFFRNFHDHEVSLMSNGKKMIYVAYYLDKLGVKGALSHGGATVSHQHANMLITHEGATSNDVIMLAQDLQRRMYDAYGIIPEPECQLLGFDNSPLAPEHITTYALRPSQEAAQLQR